VCVCVCLGGVCTVYTVHLIDLKPHHDVDNSIDDVDDNYKQVVGYFNGKH